jgi:excisionase family DNA binding protein
MARIPAATSSYRRADRPVKRFLRTRDLCERYGVTKDTIAAWVKAGRLRPIRFGPRGHFLFAEDKLPDLREEASS